MKDEKMSHNNPAFRNSTVTLGMPQEPRESYLSSNEFIRKSNWILLITITWFGQIYFALFSSLVHLILIPYYSRILLSFLFSAHIHLRGLSLYFVFCSEFTAIYGDAHLLYELKWIFYPSRIGFYFHTWFCISTTMALYVLSENSSIFNLSFLALATLLLLLYKLMSALNLRQKRGTQIPNLFT